MVWSSRDRPRPARNQHRKNPRSEVSGTGDSGHKDGRGTEVKFDTPSGVAVDVEGNIIVIDSWTHCVRKIAPDGTVTTISGSGDCRVYGHKDGSCTEATFDGPCGVAVDGEGNIIVADEKNHRVRKVAPDGTVTTVAGTGNGYRDGPGTEAMFAGPCGVAVDGEGNIIVADHGNHRVRKIAPDGTVTTVAGSRNVGYKDGPGTEATFDGPCGVAVDGEGNIIVADRGNHRVRQIAPDGWVTTIAGGGEEGVEDGSGEDGTDDDGPDTAATFAGPCGVAVDGEGSVIVADRRNHCVRKVAPDGTVTTVAGTGEEGYKDGPGTRQCSMGRAALLWTARATSSS
jgi:sugar lactone lactonase YvrE